MNVDPDVCERLCILTLNQIDKLLFPFWFAHYILSVGNDVKQTRGADLCWSGWSRGTLKRNVNELQCEWGTIEYFAFPALDVRLDVNANGHSEQFKHSCIVQPRHYGYHCNKSNVTALGSGTEDCHWFNKLYQPLRRYFSRTKGRWYADS